MHNQDHHHTRAHARSTDVLDGGNPTGEGRDAVLKLLLVVDVVALAELLLEPRHVLLDLPLEFFRRLDGGVLAVVLLWDGGG